ncbi:hypothetical protein Naga_100010g42 [Nannochloropsis gaditana]|uniref:Uncharacterized protein n=2 Tax=Nannochloropsis gaditana TaxID=72520 RepID=W7U2Q5_9STRA|nr:hypothetical protein Naga_100010g42 [Nannochloropsis gaditana]
MFSSRQVVGHGNDGGVPVSAGEAGRLLSGSTTQTIGGTFNSETHLQQPPQKQLHHVIKDRNSPTFYQKRSRLVYLPRVGPLERTMKWALTGFAIYLALTFLGVVFLVLKSLEFDKLPPFARTGLILKGYWLIFTPFWAADLVAWMVVLWALHWTCSLRTSGVQHESRIMAPSSHREAQKTLSTEMLPLFQIVMRALLNATPFLLCITAAHILLFIFLQSGGGNFGRPWVSLWLAILPIVLWEMLALISAICLRTGSFSKALGWLLILFATLMVGLRFSSPPFPLSSIPCIRAAHNAPLWVTFTPFWALEILLLATLVYVSIQACCARRYRLSSQHVSCIILYTSSLGFLALASVMFAWRHGTWESGLNHALRLQNFSDTLSGIATLCAVGFAELGFYLVAADEVEHLTTSHGYEDPMPLSRTARGWEPTGARVSNWLLLGRLEETARLMRRGGLAGTSGSTTAAAGRGLSGVGVNMTRNSPLRDYQGYSGREGRELRRSNSGSYADLYDDL